MKRFRKIYRFLSIAAAIALICCYSMSIAAYDSNADTDSEVLHYEYPTKATGEWISFENHKEMLEAVQVPEELLKQMSTEEVVTTVLENPLLVELYVYDTISEGYDHLCKNLNCVAELDSRPDAISCLSNVIDVKEISNAMESNADDFELSYYCGYRILQCLQEKAKLNQ